MGIERFDRVKHVRGSAAESSRRVFWRISRYSRWSRWFFDIGKRHNREGTDVFERHSRLAF